MKWIFLFLMLAVCLNAGADVVKIGVLLPLTGEYDFVGKANMEGMQMALSESAGKTKHQYKVVYEDTEFIPGKTSLAAQKLINVDKVDILASLWGPENSAVAPLAELKKIPHLAQDWNISDLSRHKYTFKISQPCDDYADAQLKVIQRLGCHRVALVWQNSADWVYEVPYLLKALKGDPSITIVANENFISPVRDFRTVLTKVNKTHPDILVVWSILPESEIILKQAHELGLECKYTGYYEDLTERKLGEGMHFVCSTNPAGAWVAAYKAKYKHDPAYAVNLGYDQMETIIKAYETFDHKPDGLSLVNAARNMPPWMGASGLIRPRKDGMIDQAIRFVKYQNGQMIDDPEFADLNKEMGW